MLADFKGKFNKAGDAADDNKTVAQKREDFSDNYTKVLEEAKEKFNFSVPRI
jgi:hypothetical protein